MRIHLGFCFAVMALAVIGCGVPEEPPPGEVDAGRDVGADQSWEPDAGADAGGRHDATASSGASLGGGCATDDDCASETCLTGDGWPGGYCGTAGCDDCPETCWPGDEGPTCARRCSDFQPCRAGYECLNVAPETSICVVRTGKPHGAPCAADDECAGGTCLADWPGGYCTQSGCDDTSGGCSTADVTGYCEARSDVGLVCLRSCLDNTECRDGYACGVWRGEGGVCRPPSAPIGFQGVPYDVSCAVTEDGTAKIAFQIDEPMHAFHAVPFVEEGFEVVPRYLEHPGGREPIGWRAGWDLRDLTLQVSAKPVPIGPRYWERDLATPGDYVLEVETEAREACLYVAPSLVAGQSLDVVFHVVGIPGLDAASAPQDPTLQTVLDEIDTVFGAIDVRLDEVTYQDASDEDATRFQFLRSYDGVGNLFETSRPETGDGRHVNVFLVRGFSYTGVLGISGGIPGPVGLHGTSASGVVIAYETLMDEPERLASTVAHELGHFLGLTHTTESDGSHHDLHDDTPRCLGAECPGRDNLMYPFAVGESQLSYEQRWVLKTNPLLAAEGACACGPLADCVDSTTGACQCIAGLQGDGTSCSEVTQCADGTAGCADEGSVCTERLGPAACACDDGWEGDGTVCDDVDECESVNCPSLSTCVNQPGAYECRCDPGYDMIAGQCEDVDECVTVAPCGAGEVCVNLEPGYECSCPYDTIGTPPNCSPRPARPARILAVEDRISCGLKSDGSVKCWGDTAGNVGNGHPGPFDAFSITRDYGCGIRAIDSTIECWGDLSGSSYAHPAPTGTFQDLECEANLCCGLDTGGEVYCWGRDLVGFSRHEPGPFLALDTGSDQVCAVRVDHLIQCWNDSFTALPVPPGVYNEIEHNAFRGGCAVSPDQSMQCWDDFDGAAPAGTFDVLAGKGSEICGIDALGVISCWSASAGSSVGAPITSRTFSEIAYADDHACGVETTGEVYCWGDNYDGQSTVPPDFL